MAPRAGLYLALLAALLAVACADESAMAWVRTAHSLPQTLEVSSITEVDADEGGKRLRATCYAGEFSGELYLA